MPNEKAHKTPATKNRRFYWRMVSTFPLLLFILYMLLLAPSHWGNWSPAQMHLPQVEVRKNEMGDSYDISKLRDFRYNPDGSVRAANYIQQSYALTDLQQVWFGISHFGGYGFAHTLLSFEFSGDNFLAASVEARLRPTQNYHPIRGLMRQYNKMVVLGTEVDIIGLRSHIREERVLLYPLQLTLEQREYLFKAVLQDAQEVAQRPAFYNTLLDNCTTNLLKHDPDYRFYNSFFDYRLLLPGYSDEVAQEKGWIVNDIPLAELRSAAQIDPAQVTLDAPDFSRVVRRGWDK